MSARTASIRVAYIRLKRKLTIFFTLWFLAILLSVTLVISSFFVFNNFVLKLWAIILVLMMSVKVAYDTATGMKREYEQFKEDTGHTDSSLKTLMSSAGLEPPKQPDKPAVQKPQNTG